MKATLFDDNGNGVTYEFEMNGETAVLERESADMTHLFLETTFTPVKKDSINLFKLHMESGGSPIKIKKSSYILSGLHPVIKPIELNLSNQDIKFGDIKLSEKEKTVRLDKFLSITDPESEYGWSLKARDLDYNPSNVSFSANFGEKEVNLNSELVEVVKGYNQDEPGYKKDLSLDFKVKLGDNPKVGDFKTKIERVAQPQLEPLEGA